MVSGRCHLAEAWRQRGNGVAATVTQEGWAGFEKHSKSAGVHFANAWDRRPENPLAARDMMGVLLSGDSVANESIRFWFVQAISARFDDMPSYRGC
ncbi:MAG: hypothetical protein U1D30_11090 [Planctomycetota bacterium]